MASATVRSRSSGSSASSLSSTFSDITCATDLSASSSPPGAKTNAFFASPFNTRPPSPTPTPPAPSPPRSLTADFFATPVKPPSPPASTSPRKHTQHSQIHASRIFPSRYTTESTRSPEFSLLSLDELAPHTYQPPPTYHSHARTPSDGSEDSIAFASPISSIFAQPRLPTPPPPPTPAQKRPAVLHREDTIIPPRSRPVDDQPLDEHTPRPPSREPGLLHFERSLLLARQAEAQAEVHKRSHPPDHGHNDIEEPDEEEEDEELKEGSIITLPPMTSFAYTSGLSPPPVRAAPLPISPLALAFTLPDPTLQSPPDRGTRTPKPMGDPSDALPSGPDSPGAAVFSPYLHPQYDGSHPPPATSSLPSPLPLSRSPSGTALALSTSSSSSSISGQHGQAYTQSPITTVPASQLRLLRPLGHGAFSTVWLAEDLSKVPLTLVSKKSVRDLRRRASGRDGGERERDVLREKERARRARDRESTRTPEPVPTLHNAAKETTDDTPRPPAARSPKSIRGLVDPIPLPTPLQSASASQASIVPTITTVPPPPPPPPPKSPHRQSSRIREGLRSMLAFSRGAGAALASAGSHPHPHPSGANVDVETKASNLRGHTDDAGILHRLVVHSPHSSEGSLSVASTASVSHPAAMDVKDAHSESPTHMHNEADVDMDTDASPISPASPVSRASSIRSVGSSTSAVPPSLSRASSMSVRIVDGHHHHQHDDEDGANAALLRDASLRKFRARVRGTRPALRLEPGRVCLDERDGEMGVRVRVPRVAGEDVDGEGSEESEGGLLRASLTRKPSGKSAGRLVAVKMTARRVPRTAAAVPASVAGAGVHGSGGSRRERERERLRVLDRQRRREEEERTRVRFVREVEVLKHISHPNITPLLAHLSTATHHILVLPYLPGGDLLGLVNNDVAWGRLSESVLRRIWIELCKAVGWMHGVGLVHRDIKLENILLTAPVFSSLDPTSPPPTLASLPALPAPFIKLTDFGLSRFVELDAHGDAEPLSTRCGSEAYAAPELVTGGGVYDARKTDAWACGVVLYALVGRVLPFGEGAGSEAQGSLHLRQGHSKIGGERGGEDVRRGATAIERRHWLMKIAKGEWEWPGAEEMEEEDAQTPGVEATIPGEELVGSALVKSRGARRIVGRLLVRDTRKRARIADLWDDAWMRGGEDEEGVWWRGRSEKAEAERDVEMAAAQDDEEVPAARPNAQTWDGDSPEFWKDETDVGFYDAPTGTDALGEDAAGEVEVGDEELEDEELEELEEEEGEDGYLFDKEGIDSITRQEVI